MRTITTKPLKNRPPNVSDCVRRLHLRRRPQLGSVGEYRIDTAREQLVGPRALVHRVAGDSQAGGSHGDDAFRRDAFGIEMNCNCADLPRLRQPVGRQGAGKQGIGKMRRLSTRGH